MSCFVGFNWCCMVDFSWISCGRLISYLVVGLSGFSLLWWFGFGSMFWLPIGGCLVVCFWGFAGILGFWCFELDDGGGYVMFYVCFVI